jgi:hypothetical protein
MSRDPMTPATPTPSPVLHGRYRIEAKLGAGRLAVVYRAYDERLQRPVLVHLFRRDLLGQEPLRQRFVLEAQSSARRSHPSLLDVFDSGEVGGRPFMVTEHVAGRTLREIGALSLEEALLYFRQLVGAVAVCQAAGVPHPPISGSNVVLVGEGHVELLENWATTPAERAVDLASYRPPERAAGPAGAAAAVYSLGLLLIEMLTGRPVFAGEDPRAVAALHLTAEIPPLAQIQPLLYAPSLDTLIRRATARDPARRPADAAALGQALDDLRRTYTGDTQRLVVSHSDAARRSPTARERLDRITGALPRPRPPGAPPAANGGRAAGGWRGPTAQPVMPPGPAPAPPRQTPPGAAPSRRRSLTGLGIILALFVAVACGAYYLSSAAAGQVGQVFGALPAVALPDWLTGVVSGEGEVLVVTIGDIEGLNLRDAPSLRSNVIGLLPNGARVRKIGGPRTADDVPWLMVRAEVDGQVMEGWVSANFVRPQ